MKLLAIHLATIYKMKVIHVQLLKGVPMCCALCYHGCCSLSFYWYLYTLYMDKDLAIIHLTMNFELSILSDTV